MQERISGVEVGGRVCMYVCMRENDVMEILSYISAKVMRGAGRIRDKYYYVFMYGLHVVGTTGKHIWTVARDGCMLKS